MNKETKDYLKTQKIQEQKERNVKMGIFMSISLMISTAITWVQTDDILFQFWSGYLVLVMYFTGMCIETLEKGIEV
tara:strand:- start:5811 stop:6038 length:228 start_codon:yes stop_codon:yes gene_type:complete